MAVRTCRAGLLLACMVTPWALAATSSATPAAAVDRLSLDSEQTRGLQFRLLGPYRGGRSTAVTGVRGDESTFYMGSTGGGVWKSDDGGHSWKNVSDGFFSVGSIGAIAVADDDPNVVFVGTGSACPRGNVSPGDGVYRSRDAGATWERAGLEEVGQIGRIRIHPRDPDLVYVAALGHIFGPNEERGVYRSRDGGDHWEKVLFVSDRAGAVDLSLDPSNPRRLFAAVWPVVRRPWTLESGSEEGGLYRSTDGGDHWEKLGGGLPEGVVGRIGVAVSPARPQRIWALVEAEEGGLFRSDDGGDSWERINTERKLRQRAWYYTHVTADPVDENVVYVMNVGFHKSVDGGRTWEKIGTPHGDNHDLWIHPDNPHLLINANDGGANISYNGGRSWSTQANQPTAEIYRLTVDDQTPYRVYGSQQDNSSLSLPSRTPGAGITRRDWYPVGGGESGHIAVDPRNPEIVYAGSYGGTITRHDHASDTTRRIMAYPQMALGQAPRDLRYRFQWNAPIRLSPHDPDTLYHASNHLHRSRDGGLTWEIASPDLTRNDLDKQDYSGGPITLDNTGVEVYGTIFSFEPSPLTPGLLWVGTDDGRVHISRDDGTSWREITPPSMPEWGQVNAIDLSTREPGRALLAVTRYKQDDFRPYVFRTSDYGASWSLLTDGHNGIPADHFVRVVREDPDRPGLLYAGTEFGLYVSFDDGARWQSLQLNLPVTPVTDLAVTRQDLVVATQGRGFWILDDLTPLHQLTPEVAASEVYLFQPRPTPHALGAQVDRPGLGENPPNGVQVFFLLDETPDAESEVTLDFLTEDGVLIERYSNMEEARRAPDPFKELTDSGGGDVRVAAESGLNRFVWEPRYPDAELRNDIVLWGQGRGPRATPGIYEVRLTVGDATLSRSFELTPDPRVDIEPDVLEAQLTLALETRNQLSEVHRAVGDIRSVRDQVEGWARRATEAGLAGDLAATATKLTAELTAIEEQLTQPRSESLQDPLNFPPQLDNQLAYLYGVVTEPGAIPSTAMRQRLADLESEVDSHTEALRRILTGDLVDFNRRVRSLEIPAVIVPPRP